MLVASRCRICLPERCRYLGERKGGGGEQQEGARLAGALPQQPLRASRRPNYRPIHKSVVGPLFRRTPQISYLRSVRFLLSRRSNRITSLYLIKR
jgi:hypothetical protein